MSNLSPLILDKHFFTKYSGLGQAIVILQDHIENATKHEPPTQLITNLDLLGASYFQLFDYETACIHHQQACDYAKQSEPLVSRLAIQCNLGLDMVGAGNANEGISILDESLHSGYDLGHHPTQMNALAGLAHAYCLLAQYEVGLEYTNQLLQILRKHPSRNLMALAIHAKALCQQGRGFMAEASQLWQRAIFYAQDTGQRSLLWQAYARLALVAPNKGMASVHNQLARRVVMEIVNSLDGLSVQSVFMNASLVKQVISERGSEPN